MQKSRRDRHVRFEPYGVLRSAAFLGPWGSAGPGAMGVASNALDGDADRVLDEKGHVVDGDQLLAVIAEAWKEDGRLARRPGKAGRAQRPPPRVLPPKGG